LFNITPTATILTDGTSDIATSVAFFVSALLSFAKKTHTSAVAIVISR
jgi:hypothetical protein